MEAIYRQAKASMRFSGYPNENFVVYGTVDDPNYARVPDRETVEKVVEDAEGKLDDFENYIKENHLYQDLKTKIENESNKKEMAKKSNALEPNIGKNAPI